MNALRNDGLSLKTVTALAATLAGAVLYTARIAPGWANQRSKREVKAS